MAKLRVENYNDLVRDTDTQAIINTNKTEYELYMFRHRERQEQGQQIRHCILDINSALDVNVKAANNTSHELLITPLNFTIGSDMVAVTGKKEFNFLGYSKNPTITVSQNDPLPLKVLAMAIELQFV